MASFNQVIVVGNLGKDPEIRTVQSGDKVASFSVASSETWTDKRTGEKKEQTEWHNVVVWNQHLVPTVEKFLAKGDGVMVVGKMKTRKWLDKEGHDRWSTEVNLGPFNSALVITRCKAWQNGAGTAAGEPEGQKYGDHRGDSVTPTSVAGNGSKPDLDDVIPF